MRHRAAPVLVAQSATVTTPVEALRVLGWRPGDEIMAVLEPHLPGRPGQYHRTRAGRGRGLLIKRIARPRPKKRAPPE